MSPEEVKIIQRRLQSKGLYVGPVNGVMGKNTKAALRLEPKYDAENAGREADRRRQEAEIQRANEQAKAERDRLDQDVFPAHAGLNRRWKQPGRYRYRR